MPTRLVHIVVDAADPSNQADAVRQLQTAGAVPADVGQRDVRWVVLADPEGSEFCVLTPR
jgi:hypothetical protein